MMTAMTPTVIFESCVESLESAMASARGGAGRVELCANLDVGGTTPDVDLIRRCAGAVPIPVFTMIRPRDGDFCYVADDLRAMTRDISAAANAGAHGIVVGALCRNGTIDTDAMRRLIDAARPLAVTCHRAVDLTRDLNEALDVLIELGVDRVLTSGGAVTAAEGADTIARLVTRAESAITVIAAGSVRPFNVARLVEHTRVREVHAHLMDDQVSEFVAAISGRV
jgi:copper homeostasis protein